MAKVNIEFDTISKEISVSVGGKAVAGVCGINFYSSYDDKDEFRCQIMTQAEDEENDMKSYTSLVASEAAAAKDLPASEHEGFSLLSSAGQDAGVEVQKHIAAYFGLAKV